MHKKLGIAVVARSFPEVSQTFVLDHITGLIALGHELAVFTEAVPLAAPAHADVARWDLQRRVQRAPVVQGWGRARLAQLAQLRELPFVPALRALLSPESHNAEIGRGLVQLARAAALRRRRPLYDIVHAHFAGQGERMAWLHKHGLLPGRLVVSLHGYDVTRPLSQGLKPYPLLCRYADRIVVTTGFMQQQAQALGCPAERIVRLPIGIHFDRFPFSERRWQAPEPLRLLSIGRLVPKKGIQHALRAVAEIAREGVALEYTVIGDGPLRSELQSLAATLGIAAQVRFAGALNRETTLQALQHCHLFIFPSCTAADGDQEGQGIVAQEAQASGIPVLATRHGGIPEGVDEGRSALLVAEADADALAQGLRELLRRRDDWPQMGQAGRRWVEAHFDHRRHLQGLLEIYRELGAAERENPAPAVGQ